MCVSSSALFASGRWPVCALNATRTVAGGGKILEFVLCAVFREGRAIVILFSAIMY